MLEMEGAVSPIKHPQYMLAPGGGGGEVLFFPESEYMKLLYTN